MVGVAVALMTSTMLEKSCIDLHNALKFEKQFQNSVTHKVECRHNDNALSEHIMALSTDVYMRHSTSMSYFLLSGVPDYFYRNKISSGGDLSHYSSASLY